MHRYSYSQISTYAACPTKYFLRYQAQLALIGESEHDLRFGKAWDAALNVLYSKDGNASKAREAFAASYPEREYPAVLPFWSPGKSFQGGMSAIRQYVDKWQEEDQHWDVISIQSRDKSDDDGESRTVVLDLVIRDRRDGLIYGCDNKTSGKYLDATYAAQFDPHSQIRQYVDHLQKKYGECGGFYINAASFRHRTKAYTPRKGPDKGIQLPAGDWCDFKRMVFNPNSDAVKAERANFTNWITKIEHDRKTGTWGYNTDQCVKGSITCPFHRICSAGYSWPRDADLIEQYYVQRCMRIAADGERCWLKPEHEGEHDSTRPELPEAEVVFDDEIEEAEV